MSDLLGHIKAMRALSASYHLAAARMHAVGKRAPAEMLTQHAMVHMDVAVELEAIAKGQASGPPFEDRPQGKKP